MIEMSPELATILMFSSLLVGIFMGHPLAFVLGGIAVIFGVLGWGCGALSLFMSRIDGTLTDYVLVSIPLFIFMAQLLSKAGVTETIFEAVRHLFGPVRGGAAIAIVVVSTLFAA
jgi:TRAP-type mannitol/chloroaromatic compound transport system permease large subunit